MNPCFPKTHKPFHNFSFHVVDEFPVTGHLPGTRSAKRRNVSLSLSQLLGRHCSLGAAAVVEMDNPAAIDENQAKK